MSAVIIVHLDRLVRERIAAALTVRGLETAAVVYVENGLEAVNKDDLRAVLVDPRILLREKYDIGARFTMAAGKPVRIVALTHVAGPAEAEAFQRHGAMLLIQPHEDVEMLAMFLGAPGKPLGLEEAEQRRDKVRAIHGRPKFGLIEDTGPDDAPIPFAPFGADGKPPFVLVVDDDDDVRSLLSDALIGKGYDVHATTSVPAALRYLRNPEHKVSLVISDIHMPIFDGFEFKDELDRTLEKVPPFIGITGEDTAEKYELALRLGAVALLSKPIRMRRLFRLVKAALDRAGEW